MLASSGTGRTESVLKEKLTPEKQHPAPSRKEPEKAEQNPARHRPPEHRATDRHKGLAGTCPKGRSGMLHDQQPQGRRAKNQSRASGRRADHAPN